MNRTLLGGIDEAGRGSVAGPLVLAGVSVAESGLGALRDLGVRDSKLLTPERRKLLYPKIIRASKIVSHLHIPPSEIDTYVTLGKRYRKLNYLEAIYMARIVDKLKANRVIVDACDTNARRFGREVAGLARNKCEIVSEHFADRRHVVVSAASIIAKVERDKAIAKLREIYGDFGSGYPSDPRTKRFLIEWFDKNGSRPDFARKSWKSWDNWLQTRL